MRNSTSRHRRGILGPIFIDKDTGALYSLTPLQLCYNGIEAEGEIALRFEQPLITPCSETMSSEDLLAVIPLPPVLLQPIAQLCSHNLMESGDRNRSPKVVTFEGDVVGEDLWILGSDGQARRGRLAGFDAHFRMPHPQNQKTIRFSGALEIIPMGDGAFSRVSDVGSLVFTGAGDWLGVVIAANSRVSFAAPIATLCSDLGLSILALEHISSHNKRLQTPEQTLEPVSRQTPPDISIAKQVATTHKLLQDA